MVKKEEEIQMGAKTVHEYQTKECEELLKVLTRMEMPSDNVMCMLSFINENTGKEFGLNSTALKIIDSYSYGYMMGVRSERAKHKWNIYACFHNLMAYAEKHNGSLPKNLEKLTAWVNG